MDGSIDFCKARRDFFLGAVVAVVVVAGGDTDRRSERLSSAICAFVLDSNSADLLGGGDGVRDGVAVSLLVAGGAGAGVGAGAGAGAGAGGGGVEERDYIYLICLV